MSFSVCHQIRSHVTVDFVQWFVDLNYKTELNVNSGITQNAREKNTQI